ncbi:MAG: hypothetical protein ACYC6M_11760, partial [Terriglobales bacterium]
MATLDQICSVNVKVLAGGAARASFDTVLLLQKDGTVLSAGTPIATYTSLADMAAAGWHVYDQAYIAAKCLLAQVGKPTSFKVGFWDATGGKTASQALALIDAVDAAWYFAVILSETESDIASAGAYTEARVQPALTYGQIADAGTLTGAGDGQTLKGLNYRQTAYTWHKPAAHQFTITVSGAIVAGSTINLKINGTAIAPVPFNASSNQTMDDVATKIALVAGVASAAVVETDVVDAERQILVTMNHGVYGSMSNYA